MRNTAPTDAAQLEALETREWLDSLDDVLKHGGPARVGTLLQDIVQRIQPLTGFEGFELGGIGWSSVSHGRPGPSLCVLTFV